MQLSIDYRGLRRYYFAHCIQAVLTSHWPATLFHADWEGLLLCCNMYAVRQTEFVPKGSVGWGQVRRHVEASQLMIRVRRSKIKQSSRSCSLLCLILRFLSLGPVASSFSRTSFGASDSRCTSLPAYTRVVDKPRHHFHELLLGHSTFRRKKGFGSTPLTRAGNVVSLIVLVSKILSCFRIPIQTELQPDLQLNLIGRSCFPVTQPSERRAGRHDSELHQEHWKVIRLGNSSISAHTS